MASHDVYNEATKVDAIDGEVTLDGPDGVGVSMTPTAAAVTANRLTKAAVEAAAQGGLLTSEESVEEPDEDESAGE